MKLLSKKLRFFQIFRAASIRDAATIRHFMVPVVNIIKIFMESILRFSFFKHCTFDIITYPKLKLCYMLISVKNGMYRSVKQETEPNMIFTPKIIKTKNV